jgi:RNA polymerase sigma factor (sigma-70 family)
MATTQLAAAVRHIRRLADDRKMSQRTDGVLLRAFLSDNSQAAFEALVQRHGPMVLRVCRRTLGNVHDAEDAVQATFLLLAQKATSVRKRESLASWLYGVAYRMATNTRRSAQRRHKHESQAGQPQPRDPAIITAWNELQALLDEEIASLPETLRAPFVLCCMESKSYAEAALELGLQEGTIRNRLGRARKRLQVRLTRRGLSLATVLAAVAVGSSSASAAVTRSLMRAIVEPAAQIVSGKTLAASAVSTKVIALVQGVNQTMFLTKCKTAILLFFCAGIVAAGLGMGVRHSAGAAESLPPDQTPPRAADEEAAKRQHQSADVPAKAPAKDTVKVRGQVLDPDGKPVAGAKIYVVGATTNRPAKSNQATSRDDGRFEVPIAKSELDKASSSSHPVRVLAVVEGYGCGWARISSAKEELVLPLPKDMPITGHILDPDGKPVAGAKLTIVGVRTAKGDELDVFSAGASVDMLKSLFDTGWAGPVPGRPAVLTTGADGRFKLAGVGRDVFVLFQLEGPAIATRHLVAMARPGEKVGNVYGASFDYLATASRPIRGVVRDKDTGKPIAGVAIGAQYNPAWVQNNPWCKAVTDKDGRYELLGLAKSPSYTLVVRSPVGVYFCRSMGLNDTEGLAPLTGDIEMVQGGVTVRGKVTDKASGKPIADARVDYYPLWHNPNVARKLGGGWSPHSETTTGPDGSYALTAFAGGGVIGVVAPKPEAYMPACVTIQERKDFFKEPLQVLNYQLEDSLVPDAGNYGDPPFWVSSHNAVVLLEPGEKEDGLVKDVALELPQELKGQVVGPDGQPLMGVTISGLGPNGEVKGAEFTVRGINPKATRQLVFFHKDKNLGFFLTKLPGDRSEPLTIKLQACGSASGRWVDQDGQPVAGARIHGGYQAVTTDKEGRFRIEGLVPGMQYDIRKSPLNFPVSVTVEPGQHKDLGDVKLDAAPGK